jgi:hypothetical protein
LAHSGFSSYLQTLCPPLYSRYSMLLLLLLLLLLLATTLQGG